MNYQRLFRHKTMDYVIETIGVEYEGRIQYSSQGGGFIHTMDTSKLQAEFEPYKWPDFAPANVTYDCGPDELAIPAYLNGKRWNGWVMPWFPASSLPAVIEQFPFVTFDEAREECTVCEPDSDDCYVVKAEEIPIAGGKTIKAYAVGAGAWTWETV